MKVLKIIQLFNSTSWEDGGDDDDVNDKDRYYDYLSYSFSYYLPSQASGDYCLSLAYHLHGQGSGSLKTLARPSGNGDDLVLWDAERTSENKWGVARVNVTTDSNEQVR